jgi:hypothetical protein
MPTTCVRCGKKVGLLERITYYQQTGCCIKCTIEKNRALQHFRIVFLYYSGNTLTLENWNKLVREAASERISLGEALAFIQDDSIKLVERNLAFAAANRGISPEEEHYIHFLLRTLAIPPASSQPLLERLNYLKQLTEIRNGKLPRSHTTVRLESDEICHLEIPATFHKVNTKSITFVPGRFIATNKKLHFLSPSGGTEVAWKKVMRVEMNGKGVYVELSQKTGNGFYTVPDPMLVEAVLDTLARRAKYQLLAPSEVMSREIPHAVRVAVWQRDQGKCVICGANTYLEFDHIIPFSKGGANTEANIRLLCRRCNLEKGNRI